MELINELPNEIQFNVIKFMRHPLAEMIRQNFRERKCKWCMETFSGCWEVCSDCNECEAKGCEADYRKSLKTTYRSDTIIIDPFND